MHQYLKDIHNSGGQYFTNDLYIFQNYELVKDPFTTQDIPTDWDETEYEMSFDMIWVYTVTKL